MSYTVTKENLNTELAITLYNDGVPVDKYISDVDTKIARVLESWKRNYGITIPGSLLTPVSGMAQWLDAGYKTYSDSTLLTSQKTIGGNVLGWKDKSGLNKHIITDVSKKLTYQEPILLTGAALRSDGVASNLKSAAGAMGNITAFTITIAGRYLSTTGLQQCIWGASQTSNYSLEDYALFGVFNTAGEWRYNAATRHAATASASITGPLMDFNAHTWTLRCIAGGPLEIFMDGVLVGSATDTGTSFNFASFWEYFSIGGGLYFFSNFDMYEAMSYLTRLSDSQITQNYQYLSDKWGITPFTTQLIYTSALGFSTASTAQMGSNNFDILISDGSDDGTNDHHILEQTYSISNNIWSTPVPRFSLPTDGLQIGTVRMLVDSRGYLHGTLYGYNLTNGLRDAYHVTAPKPGGPWTFTMLPLPPNYRHFVMNGTMREVSPGHFLHPCFGQNDTTSLYDVFVMESYDYGAHWQLLSVINAGDATHAWSEIDIINVSGANWIAIYRRDGPLEIWKSVSNDNCAHWSSAARFGTDSGATPNLSRLSDGLLVLTYSHGANSGIIAQTSKDNGITWGPLIYLVNGTNHMDDQCIIEIAPRKLAMVRPGTTHNANIYLDIFGEGQLQAPKW